MNRRTEVIDGNSYSFSVGMELILEKRGNFPIKLQRTRLLGWEKNLCLIIRPIEDDLPLVEFEDEQECVVRFFDSGKVNRFHTKVLRQCKYFFFPILLLMFPEQIYTTRYRKNRRYAASINGFFTNQTGEFVVNCLITDMSIKGCRLSISADNDLELENKEILLNINDTAYGNIERIKLIVRQRIRRKKLLQLGCEILSFENEKGKKAYEEILSFHESLSDIFYRV